MRANLFSEVANLLDIPILKVPFCKTAISFDQAPGKICRSITHETLYIIQNSAHLPWSKPRVIEECHEGMNSLLKIDIVLPERIVCINPDVISHILSFPMPLSFVRHSTLFISPITSN